MKLVLHSGAALLSILLIVGGCTKNQDMSSERTVANIAGTYQLTGFTKTINDITYNTFDTMSACQKDNLVRFNTDMTAEFIDAGTPCSFATSRSGTWNLVSGCIFLDGEALWIRNFNGKTLALSTVSANDPGVLNFTTWVKK